MEAGTSTPLVSIGIPVFNGGSTIERAVRSAAAQTYPNVEVVVLDNASTDDTPEICRALAASDDRVTYIRNDANIGQNANFVNVFRLSHGEWFRWLGDDDWLEPTYVEACLAAAGAAPDAIAVTTLQRHLLDGGRAIVGQYTGPRPDQTRSLDRFLTMLHLMRGSSLWIDPVYSLIRSTALSATALVRPERFGDELLACELALVGPFVHVPELLSTRTLAPIPLGWRAHVKYAGIGTPGPMRILDGSTQRLQMCGTLIGLVVRRPGMPLGDRLRGIGAVFHHYAALRVGSLRRLLRRLLRLPSEGPEVR